MTNAIRIELVVGGLGEVQATLESIFQALFAARRERVGLVPDELIREAKFLRKQKRGFKEMCIRDRGMAAAPDETTILRFRHLLEEHELCGQILDTVNLYLASKGIRISTGTICLLYTSRCV